LPRQIPARREALESLNFSTEIVLVAIVVVMSFFVPTFVLAVVLMPASVIPIVVMVPCMIMLDTPVRTVPVATVVVALCIVWNHRDCANIWRTRPIASVPMIITLRRIPVALACRANGDHPRWGRCADLDPY
jgi:hypothetical protein